MASVINRPGGHRWIQYVGATGTRQTLRMGRATKKLADEVCRRVEILLASRMSGTSLDRETAEWLTGLGGGLRARLAKLNLIDKLADATPPATLDAFIRGYVDKLNVKPSTRFNLDLARRNLVEFFGADKPLEEITLGDADEYRSWLANRLSDNTVRRRSGRAKQFFRAAVRKKLIAESPFGDMKDCHVNGNRERDHFISLADAQRVLDACPDTQWRLLFALSRFGGLRCPSEHSALRWADVDFGKGRMTVRSPKTEQYEGKESRVVPIFPELRPYLEAAKAEAAKGAEYVVTIPSVARFRAGGPSPNLGTRMQKIVQRAGLTPWPKLFHNLRATRQTELAQTFPEHVVCEWIGNSQAVAREHYLRVTDADYQRVASQTAAKGASVQNPGEAESEAVVKQNAKQQASALSGIVSQISSQPIAGNGVVRASASQGETVQNARVTPTGLEPVLPP